MKALPIFISTAFLSLGPSHAQDAPAQPSQGKPPPTSASWEKLTMQPFLDAQGMTIIEMPFPSTWKVARADPNSANYFRDDGTSNGYAHQRSKTALPSCSSEFHPL